MDNNNLERALTERTSIDKNITVTVGSSCDFATINEALTELSKFYPLYKKDGYTAEIKLKAGFVMEEQVYVDGIDLGWITITGEDNQTTIRRSSLNILSFYGDYYAAFGATNGTLPRLQQTFNIDNSGSGSHICGVHLYNNGNVVLNGGIKNNLYAGIFAENCSTVIANNSVFTNCNYGILANSSSIISCKNTNCSNATTTGVYATRCSNINFDSGVATNTGDVSVFATLGGKISAYYSNCSTSNSNKYEYYISGGGIIEAHGATGGTKTNVAINTINAEGIIFK